MSGGYCLQCHHVWLAHDDGTDDGDHCRACPCDGFVPDFTDDELADLQAELDDLERTDPDVAAAAASYDQMVERITGRTMPPRPVHEGPPDGSGVTPCCNRTPFELPRTDRMTYIAALVTCNEAET